MTPLGGGSSRSRIIDADSPSAGQNEQKCKHSFGPWRFGIRWNLRGASLGRRTIKSKEIKGSECGNVLSLSHLRHVSIRIRPPEHEVDQRIHASLYARERVYSNLFDPAGAIELAQLAFDWPPFKARKISLSGIACRDASASLHPSVLGRCALPHRPSPALPHVL